jgi:hypothetical protein
VSVGLLNAQSQSAVCSYLRFGSFRHSDSISGPVDDRCIAQIELTSHVT